MVIRTRRLGGRAFIAVAAVLVSLTLFATAAQASEWEIGGALMTAKGVSSESTAGTGGAFTVNGKILGTQVEMTCASSTSSGSVASGGQGSLEISLSACSAKEKYKTCTASMAPIKASRELIELEGTLYERYKPAGAATQFTVIELRNCPVAGNYQLKGEFGGAVPQSGASVERAVSFSPTANSAIGAVLKISTEPAAMTGALNEHLSGSFSGQAWRGIRYKVGPSNWQIEESGVKHPLVPGQVESLFFKGGPVTASWKIGGSPFKFTCTGLSGKNAVIKYGGVTEEKLAFSGCKIVEPVGCTVASSFETQTVRSELVAQVDGYDYSRFDAGSSSNPMAYVQISGCAASNWYPIYGTFGAKGGVQGSSKYTQPLELSSAANALTGSQLKIGVNEALSLSGSASLELGLGWPWGSV